VAGSRVISFSVRGGLGASVGAFVRASVGVADHRKRRMPKHSGRRRQGDEQ
jgi:hypothetical protein